MRERVRTARVARLATIDPDGRPHLVPIVFVLDGERLYSAVDAKPKRSRRLRRVANARERPDVTVLVDHYGDDWSRLWWVSLRGRARVLEAGDEAERALRLLVDKYEQYRRELPGRPVLAVDILEWRSWDASATAFAFRRSPDWRRAASSVYNPSFDARPSRAALDWSGCAFDHLLDPAEPGHRVGETDRRQAEKADMAELLRTHLLGERAAGVRADGSLGLRANRDPELDEPGAALVERTYLVAPPRQLLVGGVDGGKARSKFL